MFNIGYAMLAKGLMVTVFQIMRRSLLKETRVLFEPRESEKEKYKKVFFSEVFSFLRNFKIFTPYFVEIQDIVYGSARFTKRSL